MKRKSTALLSIDKSFKPVSADAGDELYPNGFFEFNITKMSAYLREHADEITPEMVSVKDHRSDFAVLDEDHIPATDYTIPIILAEISPGRYNVIDGNHRIEKAFRSNVAFIPAYKLSPKQHMPFLISLKAYHAYVECWNSKVKNSIKNKKACRF